MHDAAPPIKGNGKPFVITKDGKIVTIEVHMPITVANTVNTRGSK